MLITLLVWVYSILLFYVYGYTTSRLFIKIFRLDSDNNLTIPVIIILGLAVFTTITSYLSLIIPISGISAVILLTGGVIAFIWNQAPHRFQFENQNYIVLFLFFLALATVLLSSIPSPSNPDTALYHAQSIRWIETYPVVPGLANIHYRLAENSSWMLLNAAFSFTFLGIRSLHLEGSVFMIIALLYFSQGFQGLYQRKTTVSNIAKSLLFFGSLIVYQGDISSPGTDLPASLFIWIIVMILIEKLETGVGKLDLLSITLLTLSIFAVTVKLSASPLVFIFVVIFMQQIMNRQFALAAILAILGVFLATPWIVRNVILSGYLIFPLDQIDIFKFDWKYPRTSLEIVRTGIIWFARFPIQKWATFIGMPIQQWLPLWFDGLSSGQKFLFLAAVFSPMGLFLTPFLPPGRSARFWLWPFIIIIFGLLFWLLSAPNVRFGYGFLIVSIVLSSSIFIVFLFRMLQEQIIVITIRSFFILSIVLQGYMLLTSINPVDIQQHAIMPADYLPSRASPCPIKNAMLFCHKVANQCNYDLFPCIANPQPNVEMRGLTYRDGFRNIGTQQ